MPLFVRSVLIAAPVADVFGFHERADALSLLAPSFPPVRIIRRTGGLEAGARVELRIGILRWVALHTACEKNRFFEDQQIEGPFAHWLHRHEFEPVGPSQTRLTDRIHYQLPGGSIINALFSWAVNLELQRMFARRHRVTREFCERSSARETAA